METVVLVAGRGLLDQPGEEEGLNKWLDSLFTSERRKISLYRIDPEDEKEHLDECGDWEPEIVVLTEEQVGRADIFGLAILRSYDHAVVRDGQLRILDMDGDRIILAPPSEGEMIEVPDEEAEEA